MERTGSQGGQSRAVRAQMEQSVCVHERQPEGPFCDENVLHLDHMAVSVLGAGRGGLYHSL